MRLITIILLLSLTACMGRQATPTQSYQYGDEKQSCVDIDKEIDDINAKIAAYPPDSQRNGSNFVLGAVGAVLFWPALFFIDPTEPEKVEIAAYKDRIETLEQVKEDRKCPGYLHHLPKPYKA